MSRIIPAHAGQTLIASESSAMATDHPRACGANVFDSNGVAFAVGSSPRMRGKPCRPCRTRPRRRIIPAHAGQTDRRLQRRNHPPDHPRACGANEPVDGGWQIHDGSSPRMRGKLLRQIRAMSDTRIIPAHAGQTRISSAFASSSSDHPRACGANQQTNRPLSGNSGSSPRMRGKHTAITNAMPDLRIIPAHAGQTCGAFLVVA